MLVIHHFREFDFNPRLPSGRRPPFIPHKIRIHANFNPRLPSGRRPFAFQRSIKNEAFQSTPPEWEATAVVALLKIQAAEISIHASRVGGDRE